MVQVKCEQREQKAGPFIKTKQKVFVAMVSGQSSNSGDKECTLHHNKYVGLDKILLFQVRSTWL